MSRVGVAVFTALGFAAGLAVGIGEWTFLPWVAIVGGLVFVSEHADG